MKILLFLLLFFLFPLFAATVSLTQIISAKTRQFHFDTRPHITVSINPAVLKKDQSISIDLPENLSITLENLQLIHRAETDFTWTGNSVNGSVEDYAQFTTKDSATYGVIVFNKIKYIMQKNSDGTYRIYKELNPPQHYGDDFRKLPPDKSLGTKPVISNQTDILSNTRSSPFFASKLRSTSNVINVMILYTQAYADYYGSGLAAKIQFSIDYANIALSKSGVALTYNLAHQALYDNALSNETVDIDMALYHISGINSSAGTLDISINEAIRRLRATYNIDETALFRLNATLDSGGETIGIGWIPYELSRRSMQRSSYNVSEYSDETFAHESGHNLGCGHSRDVDNCSGALFSYGCGYNASSFGTIMSYNYNTIQYYSNPDLYPDETNGAVIGEAESDCSRTIEETKSIASINDDITELNEDGNNLNAGYLDDTQDRDWYQIGLGGETTFEMSNIYFYINLYDADGFLIRSFSESETVTLDNGIYNLIIANGDDTGNSYWIGAGNYGVNITTNYVEPPEQSIGNALVPIINYLLF